MKVPGGKKKKKEKKKIGPEKKERIPLCQVKTQKLKYIFAKKLHHNYKNILGYKKLK